MSNKLVKCRAKGPKGLWVGNTCYNDGDVVELKADSAASKAARGNIYAKGEWEGIAAAAKAVAEASQDEPEPKPKSKAFTKPTAKKS